MLAAGRRKELDKVCLSSVWLLKWLTQKPYPIASHVQEHEIGRDLVGTSWPPVMQILSVKKDRHYLVVTKDHWSLQIFAPFWPHFCVH